MPTLTLTFNLPEEQYEANQAERGADYFAALFDIVSEARSRVKYENAGEEMDSFYRWMLESLKDRNIDPFG